MLSQADRLKILKIIYDEQRTSSKKLEEKTGENNVWITS